jgi:hypothetical protein
MDKFDRRPNRKQKRQKLVLALVAFLIPAIWFGSLFAFGNDAAPWAILGYVLLFGGVAALNGRAYLRRLDLWRAGMKAQPEQGPGFSPLELAALNALLGGTVRGLAGMEVRQRYNSGHGCVTTLSGDLPIGASDRVACFRIQGVDAPVGACFWPASGSEAAMIEFFTRGDSAELDWLGAPFDEIPMSSDLVRPEMRPVVSEASWKHFRYEG